MHADQTNFVISIVCLMYFLCMYVCMFVCMYVCNMYMYHVYELNNRPNNNNNTIVLALCLISKYEYQLRYRLC